MRAVSRMKSAVLDKKLATNVLRRRSRKVVRGQWHMRIRPNRRWPVTHSGIYTLCYATPQTLIGTPLAVQLDKRKLSSAADRFASLRSGVRYRETNMGRKELLILSALIVGFGAYAEAQTVISPSRMFDWSSAGVPGGIPTRATICATLNAGATATS